MDKKLASFFDQIASAIRSLGAVVFAMLMVISGMIFFSHTLFGTVFPDTMTTWEKIAATWAMALAWECTVLITTVNAHLLPPKTSKLMAICSGVIVFFFIRGFDPDINWIQAVERFFVGSLVAYVNYTYAELFEKKWQERHEKVQLPFKLSEVQSKLNEALSKLIQRDSTVNQLQSKLNEMVKELDELRSFKSRIYEELTCPHCSVRQGSYGTLHAHKGHCTHNPKRGVKLNGVAHT